MEKKLYRCIGRRFKIARTAAGLTQNDVATRCKVSRQTVSNWENGAPLSAWHLHELCLIYGVSADLMLFGIKTIPINSGKMIRTILGN